MGIGNIVFRLALSTNFLDIRLFRQLLCSPIRKCKCSLQHQSKWCMVARFWLRWIMHSDCLSQFRLKSKSVSMWDIVGSQPNFRLIVQSFAAGIASCHQISNFPITIVCTMFAFGFCLLEPCNRFGWALMQKLVSRVLIRSQTRFGLLFVLAQVWLCLVVDMIVIRFFRRVYVRRFHQVFSLPCRWLGFVWSFVLSLYGCLCRCWWPFLAQYRFLRLREFGRVHRLGCALAFRSQRVSGAKSRGKPRGWPIRGKINQMSKIFQKVSKNCQKFPLCVGVGANTLP